VEQVDQEIVGATSLNAFKNEKEGRKGEGRDGRGRTTCIPHYFRRWSDWL